MQKQLPAAATRHPRHGCWSRTQQLPACRGAAGTNPFSQQGSSSRRISCGLTRKTQQTGPRERHQTCLTTQSRFLLQEAFVTTINEMTNHRMVGAVGLDQHLPGFLRPPRSTRELQQKLQALLSGSQIRPMQQAIGGQHSCQCHSRQVHSLGEHLGADKYVGFTIGELGQKPAVAIPSSGGVPVEAQQAQITEFLSQPLQHSLGPCSKRLERQGTA